MQSVKSRPVALVHQVYLVMEYQSGGELFSYMKEEGTFTEVWYIPGLMFGTI